MKQTVLVNLMCELNDINHVDYIGNYGNLFKIKFEQITNSLSCDCNDFFKEIPHIPQNSLKSATNTLYEWKYICLNFYILHLINQELLSKSNDVILSVQEIKKLKTSLKNFVAIGIQKNLQKNLPHQIEMSTTSDVIFNYNMLKCTVNGLVYCVNCPNLRMLILPDFLQQILVALHQLAFCSLKKPSNSKNTAFILSDDTYNELLNDQKIFKKTLDDLRDSVHSAIFVKETMLLFQAKSPLWFKKSVSNTLTTIIRSEKGIQNIASAMLNTVDDDRAKTWQILEILTKLIMSCRKFPDFELNICRQLLNLLDLVKVNNSNLLIFERLFVSCTKMLHLEDKELCEKVFIKRIVISFEHFIDKDYKFSDSNDNITDDIKQTIRLIYGSFVDSTVNMSCLPKETLKSVINVIFQFYSLTVKTSFLQTANNELNEILIKYLQYNSTVEEITDLFDNFIFGFQILDIPQFRNDIILEIQHNEIIKVKTTTNLKIIYATAEAANNLMKLIATNQKVLLFGYLLKCLTEKEKYFKINSSSDLLLSLEDNSSSNNPVFEKLLVTQKLLSKLAEDKSVQDSIKNNPDDIIQYFQKMFLGNHLIINDDDEDNNCQMLFIVLMILENLILNCTKTNLIIKYKILIEPLIDLDKRTSDVELKGFCERIIKLLTVENVDNRKKKNEKEMTELEKAIEDISDPLLPVRGHGLMVLGKLIRNKDKNALERTQYILNIFQLSLKNEDSFIYLNGIEGLAAMANIFPTTVLNVLCEEYSDFSKKSPDDGHEVRMKLGEVLLRVTKLLGDMAPKYKSLLLNTFLTATKDDDHLIRASSLSNLGEVCKVLGYKLGSIHTEILVCIHAIITIDKAVEARRAAVTVIRQLFVGLESEMISFLKDDILPIYRTLKEIYYHDKDDVMRLQAQLALEELNENMRSFVFPKPQLNLEKKIVMLD